MLVPFAVYAVVATAAFSLFGRQSSVLGILAGVVMGGALYLLAAVILVKFGWNPPQWGASAPRQRSGSAGTSGTDAGSSSGSGRSRSASTASRGKPSPTARTNAGNHRARRSSR